MQIASPSPFICQPIVKQEHIQVGGHGRARARDLQREVRRHAGPRRTAITRKSAVIMPASPPGPDPSVPSLTPPPFRNAVPHGSEGHFGTFAFTASYPPSAAAEAIAANSLTSTSKFRVSHSSS